MMASWELRLDFIGTWSANLKKPPAKADGYSLLWR